MEIDGYEVSEIEMELDVIQSQKAFVLQKLGSLQESLAIYDYILAKDVDSVMKAIAANNSLAIFGSTEIIKVSKALRLINAPSIIAKLNSAQTFVVEYNAMVYSLLVKKVHYQLIRLESRRNQEIEFFKSQNSQ